MRTQRHRGSRVLYIAGSVGEFPEDVQDWLSRPENPAIASSNPYDALALLAKGLCPAALIVSMQSLDWSEMEFFDHVGQLCRETTVFVSGPDHQRAKLEAACHRGASFFNADAASEAILADRYASGEASTAGIMAGSFRGSPTEYPHPDRAPASHQTPIAEESLRVMADQATGNPHREETSHPAPASPGVRLVKDFETTREESENEERDLHWTPREVGQQEIPVPWLPSTQRPQRVPPGSQQTPPGGTHPVDHETPDRRRASSVELTQEEISALLGRNPPASGTVAEGRGS